MSEDTTKRLEFHNSGISKFTSRASDWIVVFTQAFNLKSEALAREKQIKKWKSRKMIEKLINNNS
jgi:putative endonuclease